MVTHHHNANVRGLDNALALGATLVVAEQHKDTIVKHVTASAVADRLLLVQPRASIMLGNITLFDIASAHSQHYLLAYLPRAQMVLAEDHYVTELKTAKPRIYHDMVRFAKTLEMLNIEVESLIDIRGWRQFTMAEFGEWTADFTPKNCPEGYDICANG